MSPIVLVRIARVERVQADGLCEVPPTTYFQKDPAEEPRSCVCVVIQNPRQCDNLRGLPKTIRTCTEKQIRLSPNCYRVEAKAIAQPHTGFSCRGAPPPSSAGPSFTSCIIMEYLLAPITLAHHPLWSHGPVSCFCEQLLIEPVCILCANN